MRNGCHLHHGIRAAELESDALKSISNFRPYLHHPMEGDSRGLASATRKFSTSACLVRCAGMSLGDIQAGMERAGMQLPLLAKPLSTSELSVSQGRSTCHLRVVALARPCMTAWGKT